MYEKTKNFYKFRYLQTSVEGDGIKGVYLPPQPPDRDILDFGAIWKRSPIPDLVIPHYKEYKKNQDYFHEALARYIKDQWKYRLTGYWFWNTVNGKKEAVFLTGLHWFYLQWWFTNWETEDGYPIFMDVDKEIFYLLAYVDEDASCYGLILGMLRRGGKSAKMGVWLCEYCMRVANANGAIQGETESESKDFYDEHILNQFREVPAFFLPEYDSSTKMTHRISFKRSVSTRKDGTDGLSLGDSLRGWIAYGPTKKNRYNKAKLKRYALEEGAKITELNVYDLVLAMKEAVRAMSVGSEDAGKKIVGKMFIPSTADEESEITQPFMDMFHDSDHAVRGKDGQTKSGLLMCFVPAEFVMSCDKYGIPHTERNIKILEDTREKYKDEPTLYASECKKNPRTVDEFFYVNPNNCQYNVRVLQENKAFLNKNRNIVERFSLEWENGKFGTRVIATPNATGHFYFNAQMPQPEKLNRVRDTGMNNYERYELMYPDDGIIGHDPVMFGKIVSKKKSMPVAYGISKYDESIDGEYTQDRLIYNATIKYPYKTGIPFVMYKYRPDDPKIYFEDMIKLCWFTGYLINIEKQHGSAISEHFKTRGCAKFIMKKHKKEVTFQEDVEDEDMVEMTAASAGMTSHYASLTATWVNYFGHCNTFIDLCNDLLLFDPSNTRKFDHAAAFGYGMIGVSQKKAEPPAPIDISELFTRYKSTGNTATPIR